VQLQVEGSQTQNYKPNMNTTIEGVGKDAPVTTNEHGAKQSKLPYRLTLADPNALLQLGRVLGQGAVKYGVSARGYGWYKISTEDHLDHAISHILAWLAGDEQDDHLEHAQCRVHMALAVELLDRRRKVLGRGDPGARTHIRWDRREGPGELGYVEGNRAKYYIQKISNGYLLHTIDSRSRYDNVFKLYSVESAKSYAEQLEADGTEL